MRIVLTFNIEGFEIDDNNGVKVGKIETNIETDSTEKESKLFVENYAHCMTALTKFLEG